MSKEITHVGNAGISLNAFEVSLTHAFDEKHSVYRKDTLKDPEFSLQTAQVMQHIDDLKIKSSSVSTASVPSITGSYSMEERLFDACASVKILTSAVSMYLNPELRDKLFNQIDLIHAADDWDSEDSPVDRLSFKSFLRWLLLVSPGRGPGLGLSASGNIIAAWMLESDRLILEFLPNDKVVWTVTRYIDDVAERGTGETNILRLSKILSPYEVGQLFKR